MYSTARTYLSKVVNISGSAKSVLTYLVGLCFKENSCYPRIATIVTATCYAESTVHRAIKKLAKAGYITICQRYYKDSGKNSSNLYIINDLVIFGNTKKFRTQGCQCGTQKEYCLSNNTYDTPCDQVDSSFVSQSPDDSLALANQDQTQSQDPNPAVLEVQETLFEMETPESPSNQPPCPPAAPIVVKMAPHSSAFKSPLKAEKRPVRQEAIRFEGNLDLPKIAEIFQVYTRYGYLKNALSDLSDLLCACSRINRLADKKKCRNKYGLLTWLTKNRKLTDGIKMVDENKVPGAIKSLRSLGLITL